MSKNNILAAFVAALIISPAIVASAHAETLTYTGTPFTSGDYSGSQIDVTLTLPGSAPSNGIVTYSNTSNPLTGLTMSNGSYFSATAANADTYGVSLDLVNGVPVYWDVNAITTGGTASMLTVYDPMGLFTSIGDSGDTAQSFSPPGNSETAGWPQASTTGTWTISGGVPEPATWAMMLIGLGSVGGVLRSRRTTQTAVA